jgi:hypothetical protein
MADTPAKEARAPSVTSLKKRRATSPSRSDGEENANPIRRALAIPHANPNARPGFRLSRPIRSSTPQTRPIITLVPSRGEGVPGPGAGRASGSIAGLPGHGEPRVRKRSPGPFRLSWAEHCGAGTNRCDRSGGKGSRRPAEELPSPARLARNDRAEHGRPRRNSTLVATIREGRRQRYPGEIARAPTLPHPFSASAREDANACLPFSRRERDIRVDAAVSIRPHARLLEGALT